MFREWTIDRICVLVNRPELLNTLHACRPGHPWNKTHPHPYLSAARMLGMYPSWLVPTDAIEWLLKQSQANGERLD